MKINDHLELSKKEMQKERQEKQIQNRKEIINKTINERRNLDIYANQSTGKNPEIGKNEVKEVSAFNLMDLDENLDFDIIKYIEDFILNYIEENYPFLDGNTVIKQMKKDNQTILESILNYEKYFQKDYYEIYLVVIKELLNNYDKFKNILDYKQIKITFNDFEKLENISIKLDIISILISLNLDNFDKEIIAQSLNYSVEEVSEKAVNILNNLLLKKDMSYFKDKIEDNLETIIEITFNEDLKRKANNILNYYSSI